MKEAVTKVIDMLTQEDFHEAFQKLFERYKGIAAGGDYFEGGLEFHVCPYEKSLETYWRHPVAPQNNAIKTRYVKNRQNRTK